MKLFRSIIWFGLVMLQLHGMEEDDWTPDIPVSNAASSTHQPCYNLRQRAAAASAALQVTGVKRVYDEISSPDQSQAEEGSSGSDQGVAIPAPSPSAASSCPPLEANVCPAKRARVTYPNTVLGLRYIWRLPQIDSMHVAQLMGRYNLTRLAAQALAARRLSPEETENLIDTSYERHVPHPSLLMNANKAVARMNLAISRKEKILVVGDYDADGMTGSALLTHCLSLLGADIGYYIAHRKDGYGLKPNIVEDAAKAEYKVLITVDNGITAFEAAAKAKELGIDLIITDHHLAHDGLPDAYTIVNPKQPGCPYPFKSLAGVGVAFKLMTLLYEQKNLGLPEKAYELMMLGTVADMVPLVGENRFWVRHGLDYVYRTGGSAAFQKLRSNAKVENPRIGAIDVAFSITPQLNALGRLDDANFGVQFLLADALQEIEEIGNKCGELNKQRKAIQAKMFDDVRQRVNAREVSLRDDSVIVLSSPHWYPGINGLVASRTVERYYKPTFIFCEFVDESGKVILEGSGRSIKAFNLFEALTGCQDLLLSYGGHVAAAGLRLKKENLPAFKERLEQIFRATVRKEDTYNRHPIDCITSLSELNPQMIQDFEVLGPFGQENPAPTLLFPDVRIARNPTWMGRGHVKCEITSGESRHSSTRTVKFFHNPQMFFKLQELQRQGCPFKLIGHPDDNYWAGRRNVEIKGIDVEKIQA